MFGVFGLFLQAAAAQVLYLTLRLESGRFPQPLRPAEERAAFAALQAGDAAARDTLIRHNLRLVAHVVKNITPPKAAPTTWSASAPSG